MAAGLPHTGVHQDVGIHLKAVIPLLDKALPPGVFDIILEPGSQRTIVPSVGQAALNLAALKNKASVFAESYDLFHSFFRVFHHIQKPPRGCSFAQEAPIL